MFKFWMHGFTIPCFLGVFLLIGVIFAGCTPQSKEESQPASERASTPAAPPTSADPAEAEIAAVEEELAAAGDSPLGGPASSASGSKGAGPAGPVGIAPGKIPPPPEAPPVSTFAPAEDLISQAEKYLKDLQKILADEADYEVYQEKICKQANTLAVIALVLGLHDREHKYKARAGAVMRAAQELAAADNYAAAKAALARLQSAAEGNGGVAVALKWEKVASLPELMKQVPTINTKLKRYLKGARFKTKARHTGGYTAVLAAIAQGSMPDLGEAENVEQMRQWYDLTEQMRDAAAEVNQAIRTGDEIAATTANKKLQQNCEDCHAAFRPDVEIE
jgi:hypothetical protein